MRTLLALAAGGLLFALVVAVLAWAVLGLAEEEIDAAASYGEGQDDQS